MPGGKTATISFTSERTFTITGDLGTVNGTRLR